MNIFKDNSELKDKSKKLLLKQGDCIKIMKSMPNNSVDLFLTDPPYKTYQSNRPTKNKKVKKISASGFNIIEFIEQLERILKSHRHFYIFCDHLTFAGFKNAINDSKSLIYKNMIIWVKNNHGAGDLKGNYAPQHELIIYGTKNKGRKLNGNRLPNVLFKKDNNKCISFYKKVSNYKFNHGTIKPVEILKQLIEKSSKKNELVFDCYAGSFSTAEASYLLGRRSFSIELDKTHFNNGKRRLKKLL